MQQADISTMQFENVLINYTGALVNRWCMHEYHIFHCQDQVGELSIFSLFQWSTLHLEDDLTQMPNKIFVANKSAIPINAKKQKKKLYIYFIEWDQVQVRENISMTDSTYIHAFYFEVCLEVSFVSCFGSEIAAVAAAVIAAAAAPILTPPAPLTTAATFEKAATPPTRTALKTTVGLIDIVVYQNYLM